MGPRGHQSLQFNAPRGIAAVNTSNSKVYIAEGGNHRVQVLNSDLSFSCIIGQPFGIDCDSTGKVYVADSYNHRIQIFTAEGKFLRMFGKRGWDRGELYWPTGIAVSTNGMHMMFVSDYNHRVSLFTLEVTTVGGFTEPYGVAVDNAGVVYVCDSGSNSVHLL